MRLRALGLYMARIYSDLGLHAALRQGRNKVFVLNVFLDNLQPAHLVFGLVSLQHGGAGASTPGKHAVSRRCAHCARVQNAKSLDFEKRHVAMPTPSCELTVSEPTQRDRAVKVKHHICKDCPCHTRKDLQELQEDLMSSCTETPSSKNHTRPA